MAINLHNRHFLKLLDFTPAEIEYLLNLAAELKWDKYSGTEEPRLTGKNIALIFEKTSTRTRCAFEVAAYDQGAHVTYLGPSGSQIGSKESMKDTARVLGRMYDGIQYRGYGQEIVEILAQHAGVPVWNGLTDEFHPTQILADLLTMREHCNKPLNEIKFAYLGDARNNMGNSLLVMAAIMGVDCRIVAPEALWPAPEVQAIARAAAEVSGARLLLTADVATGVSGAEFVHTDVWVSMGEPAEVWDERVELLKPYRVTEEVLALTGRDDVKFMHCLPAYHDQATPTGRLAAEKYGLVDGVEVTDAVFESARSIVWEQAENRTHTIEALMVATLADTPTHVLIAQ